MRVNKEDVVDWVTNGKAEDDFEDGFVIVDEGVGSRAHEQSLPCPVPTLDAATLCKLRQDYEDDPTLAGKLSGAQAVDAVVAWVTKANESAISTMKHWADRVPSRMSCVDNSINRLMSLNEQIKAQDWQTDAEQPTEEGIDAVSERLGHAVDESDEITLQGEQRMKEYEESSQAPHSLQPTVEDARPED